ncbi:MAG: rod shape-determining protein MreC [Rikenellaceae bacterium]|jgi:rod shape-determining protein MreC|nr:rod shape-determining protein MreC [Rikenellaceae bacterium]
MNRFGLFFGRSYPLLLFLLLEVLAVNYYASHGSLYHNARIRLIAASAMGGVYKKAAEVGSYMSLRRDNEAMMAELARLNNELAIYRAMATDSVPSLSPQQPQQPQQQQLPPYIHTAARVVNNSTGRHKNYFTIDKGTAAGIARRSAVLSLNGAVLGFVEACSERFSVCTSLLNTGFRTSGNVKGSDCFGSIFWDGLSSRCVTMSEVSRYAHVEQGDTIITTGYSSIFPPGAMVGTVERCDPSDNGAYFNLRVRLRADFSALRHVLVVRYEAAGERLQLERSVENGRHAQPEPASRRTPTDTTSNPSGR